MYSTKCFVKQTYSAILNCWGDWIEFFTIFITFMCSSKHVKKQKPTYYHGFSHLTFRDNDISTISVTTFTFSLFIHPGLNSAPIMSSVEDEMRSRSPSQAQHRPHLSLNLTFWFFTYCFVLAVLLLDYKLSRIWANFTDYTPAEKVKQRFIVFGRDRKLSKNVWSGGTC